MSLTHCTCYVLYIRRYLAGYDAVKPAQHTTPITATTAKIQKSHKTLNIQQSLELYADVINLIQEESCCIFQYLYSATEYAQAPICRPLQDHIFYSISYRTNFMYDNKHKCEYVLIVLSLSLFRHQGHYVLSRCWFSVCLCLRTELPGKSGDRQKLK